jgi:hypothetical protein
MIFGIKFDETERNYDFGGVKMKKISFMVFVMLGVLIGQVWGETPAEFQKEELSSFNSLMQTIKDFPRNHVDIYTSYEVYANPQGSSDLYYEKNGKQYPTPGLVLQRDTQKYSDLLKYGVDKGFVSQEFAEYRLNQIASSMAQASLEIIQYAFGVIGWGEKK